MSSRTARPEELLAQVDWVEGLARRLISDADGAEELVQRTWLAAFERPPRVERGEAGLRSWLAQVMRNGVRKRARSDGRRLAREEAVPEGADVVARVAVQQEVVAAVMTLDEPYRSTVLRARLDAEHGGDRNAWCIALAPTARLSGGWLTGIGALEIVMGWKLGFAAGVAVVGLAAGFAWVAGSDEPAAEDVSAEGIAGSGLLPEPEASAAVTEGDAERLSDAERIAVAPLGVRADAARLTPLDTAVLTGRVLDSETGAPIRGARLALTEERFALSDGAGGYRLEGLPLDSPSYLVVTAEGYISRDVRVRAVERGSQMLDLELSPGVLREVIVFDSENSQPLADVEALRHAHEEPFARSDTEGRLQIRIAVGLQSAVLFRAPGYLELNWIWDVQSVDDLIAGEPHRIPLRGLAWIEGRVTDLEGAPIEGCSLYAHCQAMPFGLRLSDEERRANRLFGYVAMEVNDDMVCETDAEGR